MKLLVFVIPLVAAFQPLSLKRNSALKSTVEDETTTVSTSILDTALSLKEEFGIFLIDKAAKKKLEDAVKAAEESFDSFDEDELLGDWDLVCTESTNNDGIDTTNFPAFIKDRIKESTNKYLSVQQKIRKEGDTVDRVDHVLSYKPPKALSDFVDNLPEPLKNINLNPLDVSNSKVTLIHKAVPEGKSIALTLKSVIWNVAGRSRILEPEGKDITSINLPLSDFLNTGKFETTYMDENVRISRGKRGMLDQLRVFVRAETQTTVLDETDVAGEEIIDPEVVDPPSDVEGGGATP